ncbi:uncharacterized protein LOC105839423 [Monomorium pharaonis]|uniref:uncharacterized protein LOC105839423 n=1 Tax=Monomorium pharaonis TaxID=307658 RepID=UPI00063F5E69|nr:uncharacterized protein LOC105839423 [Monomorium pharaonis]XP_036146268.1 uncharacterized protein LOC105839423 [Monomorium pharaonis]
MLSINMRVFKTVLVIAFFGVSVQCLPVTDSKPTESKIESQTESKIESLTESKIESQTESKIESQTEVKPEIISEESSQEPAITTVAPIPTYSDAIDYYDQRQNGTENYRIHVDGLAFVIAPIEALLLAGAAGGTSESNLSLSSLGISPTQSISELDKPASDIIHNKTESAISKTIHKQPAVRLANFLAPFIRSIRHVRGMSVH